ncbi:MAG: prepilin-type N-terminal cleavage/methylation domain-containing protein [Fimbriimonadales bacterium]|nr:prepilin-type N-terminal cleavage/methylation domain-containing protein [Fimbriimonadales bacterium]
MSSGRRRAAFSLVEVLLAVALLGIGIAAAVGSAGAAAEARVKFRQRELLTRLASSIADDLRASGDDQNNGLSGDFASDGFPDVVWSLETTPTGVTNLDSVWVTVEDRRNGLQQTVQYLVYRPPAQSEVASP